MKKQEKKETTTSVKSTTPTAQQLLDRLGPLLDLASGPGSDKQQIIFTNGQAVVITPTIMAMILFDQVTETVVVNAPLLATILTNAARVGGELISFEVADKELVLKTRGASGGVKILKPDAAIIAQLETLTEVSGWNDCPETLVDSIKTCCLSSIKDMSYHILSNVQLTADSVEACNDVEAARITFAEPLKGIKKPVLLPFAGLQSLSASFIPDQFAIDGQCIFLKRLKPQLVIALRCTQSKEEYPKLDDVFKIKEGTGVELGDELTDALRRVSRMVTQFNRYVTITLKPNKVRARGSVDQAWYSETESCVYDGPEVEFCAEPALLARMIKSGKQKIQISTTKMYVKNKNFQLVCALQKPAVKE